jgi:hypothetical protein
MAKSNRVACRRLGSKGVESIDPTGDWAIAAASKEPHPDQAGCSRANQPANYRYTLPQEQAAMALDFNDPDLEFSDLVYAYQSWVMAVINDEKLGGETLMTDDIADDALNAMRFLPGEVTSAIETSLARVYDVDADELAALLFPEG